MATVTRKRKRVPFRRPGAGPSGGQGQGTVHPSMQALHNASVRAGKRPAYTQQSHVQASRPVKTNRFGQTRREPPHHKDSRVSDLTEQIRKLSEQRKTDFAAFRDAKLAENQDFRSAQDSLNALKKQRGMVTKNIHGVKISEHRGNFMPMHKFLAENFRDSRNQVSRPSDAVLFKAIVDKFNAGDRTARDLVSRMNERTSSGNYLAHLQNQLQDFDLSKQIANSEKTLQSLQNDLMGNFSSEFTSDLDEQIAALTQQKNDAASEIARNNVRFRQRDDLGFSIGDTDETLVTIGNTKVPQTLALQKADEFFQTLGKQAVVSGDGNVPTRGTSAQSGEAGVGINAPDSALMQEFGSFLSAVAAPAAPQAPSSAEMLNSLNAIYGIDDLNEQLLDLRERERAIFDQGEDRIAQEEERTIPVGVIAGRSQQISKQENKRLRDVQRSMQSLTEELGIKQGLVSDLMRMQQQDFQNTLALAKQNDPVAMMERALKMKSLSSAGQLILTGEASSLDGAMALLKKRDLAQSGDGLGFKEAAKMYGALAREGQISPENAFSQAMLFSGNNLEDTKKIMVQYGYGDLYKDAAKKYKIEDLLIPADKVEESDKAEKVAERQGNMMQGNMGIKDMQMLIDETVLSNPEKALRLIALAKDKFDDDSDESIYLDSAKQAIEAQFGDKEDSKPDFEAAKFGFQVSKEFEDQSKSFIDVKESYQRVKASAQDPSAAGDLALIFNYMKMLDPGSVVREGEFANAQNAGSIPDITRAMYNKVREGQRLSENQRADFLNRSERLFKEQVKDQEVRQQQFRDQARIFGLEDNIFRNLLDDDDVQEFRTLTPDETAFDVIKNEEGFRTEAYLDQAGKPTIGYGFTTINGEPVQMGDTITRSEAEAELRKQVRNYTTWQDQIDIDLTKDQQAALTSFSYNLGANIWNTEGGQRLVQYINSNQFAEAAALIEKFVNFRDPETGKLTVSQGLKNRREREAAAFSNTT